MEHLDDIRTMNDLRPAGYWKARIGELCNRVEELEKELREAHENTHQATPAPRSATEVTTDEELIAFLREWPGRSLAQICERFGVACAYSTVHRSPEGRPYGYTEGVCVIRNQLQRLRRARKIRSEGQRWMI